MPGLKASKHCDMHDKGKLTKLPAARIEVAIEIQCYISINEGGKIGKLKTTELVSAT